MRTFPFSRRPSGSRCRHDVTLHGKGTLCMRCGKVRPQAVEASGVGLELKKIRRWSRNGATAASLCARRAKPLVDVRDGASGRVAVAVRSERDSTGVSRRPPGMNSVMARRVAQPWRFKYMRELGTTATDHSDWLYLSGKVGTGKDARGVHAGEAVAGRAWSGCRFIQGSHDFFSQLRGG